MILKKGETLLIKISIHTTYILIGNLEPTLLTRQKLTRYLMGLHRINMKFGWLDIFSGPNKFRVTFRIRI